MSDIENEQPDEPVEEKPKKRAAKKQAARRHKPGCAHDVG